MKEPIVQVAACPDCGKYIKMAVTETSFSRATTREFAKLMEGGFIIKQTTLEDARTKGMCFGKCSVTEPPSISYEQAAAFGDPVALGNEDFKPTK